MNSELDLKEPYHRDPTSCTGGTRRGTADRDSLSLLAGGIAHDFNNLLTVINGYSQLILLEPSSPEKVTYYAREITEAGEKAAAIVEMVLNCSGHQQMPKESFDANALLENMRGAFALLLGESISLIMRLCDQRCVISGGRGQFQCALTNLLMNSKEAMPAGGRVELETRVLLPEDPGHVGFPISHPRLEITVRDTGQGMEKCVLDRIFDPYFSTKRAANRPGLGLGLACTKGIVRGFGGNIAAESHPGAGTVLRILIPIAGQA